jgi:hypothetical protein
VPGLGQAEGDIQTEIVPLSGKCRSSIEGDLHTKEEFRDRQKERDLSETEIYHLICIQYTV